MQTGVAGLANRLSLLLPLYKGSGEWGGGYNEVANPPQEAGKESPGLRILGSTHSEYLPDTCTANTDEFTG